MYDYWAKITRVVDGDTFDADIDLGLRTHSTQRLRLRGIDTPEIFGLVPEAERLRGLEAAALVKTLIEGKVVSIKTYKLEIYGRWGADVMLPDGRDLATLLKEAGFDKTP